MLVCTLDGDLYPPLEEPTGSDPKGKKKDKDKDKKFIWNHGSKWTEHTLVLSLPLLAATSKEFQQFTKHSLTSKSNSVLLASLLMMIIVSPSPVTCPLKNTRKRRFRKTAKKKVGRVSPPPVSTSRPCLVCLFSFPSDDPPLLEALFQQCIYIS